jgi:hypothetical protein
MTPGPAEPLNSNPEADGHFAMNITVRSRLASVSGHPRPKPASTTPLQ